MNPAISSTTKHALKTLVEIQKEILSDQKVIDSELFSPQDIDGLGLNWAHYVSVCETDKKFNIISAINADADYSFNVALGDKDSDQSPCKYSSDYQNLFLSGLDHPARFSRLAGNLAVRMAQVGIEQSLSRRAIRLNPLNCDGPFNLQWCAMLLKNEYQNGITQIAGIDSTGHHVFIHLQSEDMFYLDPRLVELPAIRKYRPVTPNKSSEDVPVEFPTWIDETEFCDDLRIRDFPMV